MKKVQKSFLVLVMLVLATISLSLTELKAADPTTGSLTIICHEQKNGDATTNPPLKGIEYTIYKVDASCQDVDAAETYIEANSVTGITKTTDANGKVVYSDLALGRYYAKVTKVIDGVSYYEDFLVDIPRTNEQGTGLIYDVTAEPKIETLYGNIELIKVDQNGNPLEGVTFKVQVSNGVSPMSLSDLPRKGWVDYIPEGSSSVLTVTTDSNGKIKLSNLPFKDKGMGYRLVEISGPDGYIINPIISELRFFMSDDQRISTYYDYTPANYMHQFIKGISIDENDPSLVSVTYMNEKPTITKKVKNSAGNFVDNAGLNMTDVVTFKLTTSVPLQISDMTTYTITDTLPAGFTLDKSSIKVEGTVVTGSETVPTDIYTISDDGLTLTFDPTKMYDTTSGLKAPIYNDIIVTYNATFNDNAVIGGDGNINTAKLTYTSDIANKTTAQITDTAEAHTGAIAIEKVDKADTSVKLEGAKFKVATSKANAEAGTFVKGTDGEDIEVTTDANGLATIKGLAYADDGSDVSYWLVETQAPIYKVTEGGQEVEKTYKLLKTPVEVKVGKTTHNTAVVVQNSKEIDLPATGGIGIAIFAVVGIGIMVISRKMNKEQNIQ